jgi:hypothetical protein
LFYVGFVPGRDIALPSGHTGKLCNFDVFVRRRRICAEPSVPPAFQGNAMKLPRRNFLHLAAGAAALQQKMA